MIVQVLGGIGLFLLGMLLMTDGLKSLAGEALRTILAKAVRGPVSGVICGAGATALVQSSSATTLTTIGFVSAGLITFTQSVGVIFGANIGTTSTGWIVSQLGFKLSISAVAMPMVFLGVLMRLLFRQRFDAIGSTIAGFGLIFIGLDVLQTGMGSLAEQFSADDLPGSAEGLLGALLLVGVGIVMTVVMQSSSAAVATTLAALHADAIDINQAAALVIGQNIGTTVTALIASIGASIPARRTAASHILFNVFTAIVALALLPVFSKVMNEYVSDGGANADVTAIAAFHTAFNVLGVAILLPVIKPFCRLIERMIPQREPSLTRFLDPSVIRLTSVAVEAARHTLIEIVREITEAIEPAVMGNHTARSMHQALNEVINALEETRRFLNRLTAESQTPKQSDRLLAVLHAADHVMQLKEVCLEDWPSQRALRDPIALEFGEKLHERWPDLRAWFANPDASAPQDSLQKTSEAIAQRRRDVRRELLEATADGKRNAQDTLALLEAIRLIDQVAFHLWRSALHLQPAPAKDVAPLNIDAKAQA